MGNPNDDARRLHGRTMARIAGRARKILAQSTGGWEDVSEAESLHDIGEEVPSHTGYHPKAGGKILKRRFTADQPVPIYDAELSAGENYITIEARYDYVDAWLNNEFQIISEQNISPLANAQDEPSDDGESIGPRAIGSDFSERDRVVAEIQANADEFLQDLANNGHITL